MVLILYDIYMIGGAASTFLFLLPDGTKLYNDGTKAYVPNFSKNTVRIIDVNTNTVRYDYGGNRSLANYIHGTN